MGKQEEQLEGILRTAPESHSHIRCLTKSPCKWLISITLGVYVLGFTLWLIYFHGRSGQNSEILSPPPWLPHVEASFRLRRSVSLVNESLPQLETDLRNEIGIPNTQIDIVAIAPLSTKNWTEVRFMVSPEESNDFIAPAELSVLKDTFVELFTQRYANLTLTNTIFGKVSHFEVLQFPGGITVVPPQPGFPFSKVLVLFNFTLHSSLTRVNRNFAKFRHQLANGIILKHNESLFVQLTNLEGSTVKSPLVVQTSILPVVGLMLPPLRLKQLAQEIIASPRKNLGLNHTFFGRVKKIELSSYLADSLDSAETPYPSPCPAPSISPGHHAGHRHRSSGVSYSPTTAPAYSPSYGARPPQHHRLYHQRQNSRGASAPVASAISHLSPSPLSSLGPLQAPHPESTIAPSGPGTSQFARNRSRGGLISPTQAPTTNSEGTSLASTRHSDVHAFVPVSSPHPSSSVTSVGVYSWVVVIMSLVVVAGAW